MRERLFNSLVYSHKLIVLKLLLLISLITLRDLAALTTTTAITTTHPSQLPHYINQKLSRRRVLLVLVVKKHWLSLILVHIHFDFSRF